MLKKTISLILVVLTMSFTLISLAAEPPAINAKGAIIGEMKTGAVVYEHNADDKLYPASTTKIMTAILALENGNLDSKVTVSSSALAGLSESGSSILLKNGEEMAFRDLVIYLLVASGNDAANVLAENVSGSISAFVELMNTKAKELGCTGTNFTNTHGLHDENHYTTAKDLLLITQYAMKNKDFAEIVAIDRYVLPETNVRGTQSISTTNHLISRWRNRDYFYDGAIGIKTGSTTPAGLCLVSGVKSSDLTYITVVLGSSTLEDGTLGSFADTIKLLNYAKSSFEIQQMVNAESPVTEVPVALGKSVDRVVLVAETGFSALLPTNFKQEEVEVTYSTKENIKAPIEKGDVLGEAEYSYGGKVYGSVKLVAADSVRRSTWLYIVDIFVGILGSTVFRILMGIIIIAIIAFIIMGLMRRNRRRRRGSFRSSYRGGRR